MPSHPIKPPSQLDSFNCRRRPALIVVAQREALDIWQQSETPNDPRVGKTHLTLSLIEASRSNPDSAKEHLRHALALLALDRTTYFREIAEATAALQALGGPRSPAPATPEIFSGLLADPRKGINTSLTELDSWDVP
jgi:hypothetical protein